MGNGLVDLQMYPILFHGSYAEVKTAAYFVSISFKVQTKVSVLFQILRKSPLYESLYLWEFASREAKRTDV